LCVGIAESVGSRREFMYTPPTPTRRDSTVSSRRRRRCVFGLTRFRSYRVDRQTHTHTHTDTTETNSTLAARVITSCRWLLLDPESGPQIGHCSWPLGTPMATNVVLVVVLVLVGGIFVITFAIY